MTDKSEPVVERTPSGQFPKGQSGNPVGRPKGSRNKVTLMKLMAEEAVRTNNIDKMLEVAEQIIDSALDGDFRCRKLVWDSIMSKGAADDNSTAKEKVEINLNIPKPEKEVNVVQQETENVEQEPDERPSAGRSGSSREKHEQRVQD